MQVSFELIVTKVVQLYGNSRGVNSGKESRPSKAPTTASNNFNTVMTLHKRTWQDTCIDN